MPGAAVTFVSTNAGKAREVRSLLRPYGIRVRWLRRSLPEPQAEDLLTVARAKAASVRGVRGWVLVEDSGLFLPALGGFPGVYSAHFLKIWGFPPILELLRRRRRDAVFRSVAVLRRGRKSIAFVGEVPGTIARAPAGSHGFGYDPIFVPRGYRRTFAELGEAVKDERSHRARSVEQVGRFLSTGPSPRSPMRRARSR